MEDNFSTDQWQGLGGDGSGSNESDGEQQMKLCSFAAHLLLCGLVPTGRESVLVLCLGVVNPCFTSYFLVFRGYYVNIQLILY